MSRARNLSDVGGISYITATGNKVGIGTNSPGTKLDVAETGSTSCIIRAKNDTTSVYLDANNGYAYLNCFSNHPLLFGTNNAERMRITNDGKVLINTTDTNALITVKHTSTAIGGGVQLIKATEDNRWELLVGGDNKLYLAYGSATTPSTVGNFATNGTYTATSDERKKKDISYQFDGLSLIAALKPAMGKMLEDKESDPMRPMLIAQDVVNVLPSAVSALDPDPDAIDPILGVDYSAAIPVLIKALQESIERVEALETEVAALKGN